MNEQLRVWTLGQVWEEQTLDRGDSPWSRWRKETMKTGIRIQNISKKNYEKDFLYKKPEN